MSHSHFCTEQLIYISALSKLQEGAEISAFRYKNLNGIVDEFTLAAVDSSAAAARSRNKPSFSILDSRIRVISLSMLFLNENFRKEAVCSCTSTFVSSFFVIPVEYVCQIYQKYFHLYEHYTDKNKNNSIDELYSVHFVHIPSLHHANFGQFKAK